MKSRFKTKRLRPPKQGASTSSVAAKRDPKPSTAKPPSFLSRESCVYKPTPTRKRMQTFGESVQHYLNHGLRDSLPSTSPKKELNFTPKPPSFPHRQTPSQSSINTAKDDCKKQFQARYIGYASESSTYHNTTPLNRRSNISYTPSTLSTEEIGLEECQKQFRARPLPVARHSQARKENQQREPRMLTTPSPFKLWTNL